MSSYVFCFCFISQKYVFRIYSPNFFCSILFHGHRILEKETRWNKQGIKYWLTLDRYGRWKNGFSRHFLGTIVICMVRLSSLSLIQNRADDFCTSYAHLRRKRLREKPSFSINPSLQVRATVPASTCNRPCKYLQEKDTIRLHLGISSLHVFLLSRYHAHPSIRVVISWHDIIISCHNTIISWHDIIISCCVWFEAKG